MFRDYLPAVKPIAKECQSEDSMGSTLILNRHVPFRLFSSVGNPHGDNDVEFEWVASKIYFPKSR
jgi:hypothetical protein